MLEPAPPAWPPAKAELSSAPEQRLDPLQMSPASPSLGHGDTRNWDQHPTSPGQNGRGQSCHQGLVNPPLPHPELDAGGFPEPEVGGGRGKDAGEALLWELSLLTLTALM